MHIYSHKYIFMCRINWVFFLSDPSKMLGGGSQRRKSAQPHWMMSESTGSGSVDSMFGLGLSNFNEVP